MLSKFYHWTIYYILLAQGLHLYFRCVHLKHWKRQKECFYPTGNQFTSWEMGELGQMLLWTFSILYLLWVHVYWSRSPWMWKEFRPRSYPGRASPWHPHDLPWVITQVKQRALRLCCAGTTYSRWRINWSECHGDTCWPHTIWNLATKDSKTG